MSETYNQTKGFSWTRDAERRAFDLAELERAGFGGPLQGIRGVRGVTGRCRRG
jgi:hypothetical protein